MSYQVQPGAEGSLSESVHFPPTSGFHEHQGYHVDGRMAMTPPLSSASRAPPRAPFLHDDGRGGGGGGPHYMHSGGFERPEYDYGMRRHSCGEHLGLHSGTLIEHLLLQENQKALRMASLVQSQASGCLSGCLSCGLTEKRLRFKDSEERMMEEQRCYSRNVGEGPSRSVNVGAEADAVEYRDGWFRQPRPRQSIGGVGERCQTRVSFSEEELGRSLYQGRRTSYPVAHPSISHSQASHHVQDQPLHPVGAAESSVPMYGFSDADGRGRQRWPTQRQSHSENGTEEDGWHRASRSRVEPSSAREQDRLSLPGIAIGSLPRNLVGSPRRLAGDSLRPAQSTRTTSQSLSVLPENSAEPSYQDNLLQQVGTQRVVTQGPVSLTNWYIIKVQIAEVGRASETKVAVGGWLVQNGEHVKTSPIVNRLDIHKVVTEDGVEVSLEGTIDQETSTANGFPPGIVQCLSAGFPYLWKQLLRVRPVGESSSLAVSESLVDLHPKASKCLSEDESQGIMDPKIKIIPGGMPCSSRDCEGDSPAPAVHEEPSVIQTPSNTTSEVNESEGALRTSDAVETEAVTTPSTLDPVAPQGAVREAGCLGTFTARAETSDAIEIQCSPQDIILQQTLDASTTSLNPVPATEASVLATEARASVTEEPAFVTEEPASATEAPASVTEEPAFVTEEPASATEAPASVTEEPAFVTEEPASATEAPASVTEEPASVTEAPASVTEEPAFVTEEPASATEAPASVTDEPASVTEAPASVTEVSVDTNSLSKEAEYIPTIDTTHVTIRRGRKSKKAPSQPPRRSSRRLQQCQPSSSEFMLTMVDSLGPAQNEQVTSGMNITADRSGEEESAQIVPSVTQDESGREELTKTNSIIEEVLKDLQQAGTEPADQGGFPGSASVGVATDPQPMEVEESGQVQDHCENLLKDGYGVEDLKLKEKETTQDKPEGVEIEETVPVAPSELENEEIEESVPVAPSGLENEEIEESVPVAPSGLENEEIEESAPVTPPELLQSKVQSRIGSLSKLSCEGVPQESEERVFPEFNVRMTRSLKRRLKLTPITETSADVAPISRSLKRLRRLSGAATPIVKPIPNLGITHQEEGSTVESIPNPVTTNQEKGRSVEPDSNPDTPHQEEVDAFYVRVRGKSKSSTVKTVSCSNCNQLCSPQDEHNSNVVSFEVTPEQAVERNLKVERVDYPPLASQHTAETSGTTAQLNRDQAETRTLRRRSGRLKKMKPANRFVNCGTARKLLGDDTGKGSSKRRLLGEDSRKGCGEMRLSGEDSGNESSERKLLGEDSGNESSERKLLGADSGKRSMEGLGASSSRGKSRRGSIIPPPLPPPRVQDKSKVPEAFGLKTSRAGRLLVPALAYWRSQSIEYDKDGGIIAIFDGFQSKPADTGCFNFTPPQEKQAKRIQKRLCKAAATVKKRK